MVDEEDEENEEERERRRRERIPAAFREPPPPPAPRARAAGSGPGNAAIDAFASEYLIGLQCEQAQEAPSILQSGKESSPDAAKSLAYKGQLCKNFIMGICQKGGRCFDAHGDSELQSQPSFAGNGFREMAAVSPLQANPALLELMSFVQRPASELAEEKLRRQANPTLEAESPGTAKRQAPNEPTGDAKRPRSLSSELCGYAHDASQLVTGADPAQMAQAVHPGAEAAAPDGQEGLASMAAAMGVSETTLLQMGYAGPSKVAQAQGALFSAAHGAGYGATAGAQPHGEAGYAEYYAQVLAGHCTAAPSIGPPCGGGMQPMQQQQDQSMYRYKTIMCKFFPLGQCTKGERCTFAHFADEIAAGGGVVRRGPNQFQGMAAANAAAAANANSAAAYAAAMQAQATAMPQPMPQHMHMPMPMPQPVVVPPPGSVGPSAGPVVVPPPGYAAAAAGVPEMMEPGSYQQEAWSQSEAWSQAAAMAEAAALRFVQQQAMAAQPSMKTRGFKTQMCKFFPMGQCTKADGCTYAHFDEELKTYGTKGQGKGAAPTAASYAEAGMPFGYAGDSMSSFTC